MASVEGRCLALSWFGRCRMSTVQFSVSGEAYDRFMGRYSIPLAPFFADFAGTTSGQRVLDVGCGPGALTTELVRRVGPAAVVAVDPSSPFVSAVRRRHPGVEVHQAEAERLPLDDDYVDLALAQLVVHFMVDPIVGLAEMARVTRPGGVVAACVWDHAEGGGPLSVFWEAVHQLDPDVAGEAGLPGTRRGHLAQLFRQAGMPTVEETELSITVTHYRFDDWWDPYTLGVGPAGSYVAGLDETADRGSRRDVSRSCPQHPSNRPLWPGPAEPWSVRHDDTPFSPDIKVRVAPPGLRTTAGGPAQRADSVAETLTALDGSGPGPPGAHASRRRAGRLLWALTGRRPDRHSRPRPSETS